jgi:hypothetical protein
MSIHDLFDQGRPLSAGNDEIPEWLRQLDRESRERQRRIIVNIDDGVEPDPRKRNEGTGNHRRGESK